MLTSISLKNKPLSQDEAVKLQDSVDTMKERTGSQRAKAVGMAALYLDGNQNAKAFDVLQDLIDSGHSLVDSHYYLGEVHEKANQFDQSKDHYKIAARLASEALCAAKAGLARVEVESNQKQSRLQDAMAAFETLQKITDDDFVPVRCEEQKGYMTDILGRLIPRVDDEEGEKQLLLAGLRFRCGDCGRHQSQDIGGCADCLVSEV
jgi:tetratricopeptide (TPR) repeat protein